MFQILPKGGWNSGDIVSKPSLNLGAAQKQKEKETTTTKKNTKAQEELAAGRISGFF